MNTGATFRGWTYDEADERQTQLFNARYYLKKAIEELNDATFPYENLEDTIDDIQTEMDYMNTIMDKCKNKEEKADYRLGGDL